MRVRFKISLLQVLADRLHWRQSIATQLAVTASHFRPSEQFRGEWWHAPCQQMSMEQKSYVPQSES
jgi:hypothetical protein